MKGKLCTSCGARLGKGRNCPTCIDYREGGQNTTVVPPNATIRVTRQAPSNRAKLVEVRRSPAKVEVDADGAIAVDCACGCGRKVYIKPAYYSAACRSRAWRRRNE